ncbi:MAG: Gfo/Idh/MocA family oxidoreductase [Chitinophagaceae bacterium]
MKTLRFAVIGTGFWSAYQIPAWKEVAGMELVAVYNRTRSKATAIAQQFGIPAVYDNAEELLQKESPDFIDIITNVETHPFFTRMAAEKGIPVICQKPMADSLEQARKMTAFCAGRKVPFYIHENFRWQAPIRALKVAMQTGVIGIPFKARVSFCSGFPVFDNQPALAELPHFILTDIGSHILDICRFLFGEAKNLFCLTKSVNPAIKGEDVANVLMEMQSGLHCFAEMSYASVPEKESFPQTLILVEGDKGSLHLTTDFVLKTTTRSGTTETVVQPPVYQWADPAYSLVHASIVDCNRDIANGLRGDVCETTGIDNLKTTELVWAAYESAAAGKVILI